MAIISRQKELTIAVATYLSEWMDDPEKCIPFNESLEAIESYGYKLDSSEEKLVVSAIRHMKYIVNPWNNMTIPDILIENCGFTKDEAIFYFEVLYIN